MTAPDGDKALLDMLKHRYGRQWSIRRTENLWLATANDPDADHAPTIVQPDIEAFVRELEQPPARAGGTSLLSAPLFADQLEQAGDGVYITRRPPLS